MNWPTRRPRMSDHAVLAPSAAERWLTCTASVSAIHRALAEGAVVESDSEFAREGTIAHEHAAANILNDTAIPEPFDDVYAYTNHIRSRIQHGVELYLIEHRFDLSAVYGDLEGEHFGTGDAVLYENGTLEVHDLKYGMGVLVSAQDNVQMRIYALGALDAVRMLGEEPEKVELHIHQVRRRDLPDVEYLTVAELEAWRDEVLRPAVQAILADDTVYAPSEDACRWCAIKGLCRAQAEFATRALSDEFPVTVEQVEQHTARVGILSPAELAELYDKVPFIEAWVKAMHEAVSTALEGGYDIPGWKIVEGRQPPAKWTDEEELLRRIKMYRASKKLLKTVPLTPAQAKKASEKIWPKLEDLAIRAEPGHKVVRADNPKPEINPVSALDFQL